MYPAGTSDEGKWFVWTRDGYWNASQGGEDLAAFVINPETGSADYKVLKADDPEVLKYKRPDIIAERLKGISK